MDTHALWRGGKFMDLRPFHVMRGNQPTPGLPPSARAKTSSGCGPRWRSAKVSTRALENLAQGPSSGAPHVPPPRCPRRRLRLLAVQSVMSRGTRINDDVYCTRTDVPDEWPQNVRQRLPTFPRYPSDLNKGTGRLEALNDELLVAYGNINHFKNKIGDIEDEISQWYFNHRRIARLEQENRGNGIALRCMQASAESILVELYCLGGDMYLLHELYSVGGCVNLTPSMEAQVKSEIVGDVGIPQGALSYLCEDLHYFRPEKFEVPDNLPRVESYRNTETIGGLNTYLQRKYNALAMHINRIRYLRDGVLRAESSSASNKFQSQLTLKIASCRREFNVAAALMKGSPHEHDLMYAMPGQLRDALLSDNSIVNEEELGDVTFLYPDGTSRFSNRACSYILFESGVGLCLFERRPSVARVPVYWDYTALESQVKLVVFYPYTCAEAVEEYELKVKGIISAKLKQFIELYLPTPKSWNLNKRLLSVRDPARAELIRNQCQIPCYSFEREIFDGVDIFFSQIVDIPDIVLNKSLGRLNALKCLHTTIDNLSTCIWEWFDIKYPDSSHVCRDKVDKVALATMKAVDDADSSDLEELVGFKLAGVLKHAYAAADVDLVMIAKSAKMKKKLEKARRTFRSRLVEPRTLFYLS